MTTSPRPNPRNLIIIGVDPGLTCGFAVLHTATEDFQSDDVPVNIALDRIYALMHGHNLRTILSVERFTPNGRAAQTAQTDALEVIGAARFIARRLNALRFMTPGASEAQSIASPDVLRTLGWWAPGFDHRNRAASQVGYALSEVLPGRFADLTNR